MPRSTKAATDRRLEFISAAEALFNEKGFENTSIDDIVQRIGVAKGLFYYYFKSREELLAAIVDRILNEMERVVIQATKKEGLTAMQRLQEMSTSSDFIRARSGKLMKYFHEERNQALHLQLEVRTMKFLVPAMEAIIKQGVQEGLFYTPYPRETAIALFGMKSVIAHTNTGTDYCEDAERSIQIISFLSERLLGAKEGTFLEFLREMNHQSAENGCGK
ncbi:MAG: TetR/AcrR family transcriptional regulator [Methanomassiliicoccales archaeon]|jgi:AcrR family transcriptional regulator